MPISVEKLYLPSLNLPAPHEVFRVVFLLFRISAGDFSTSFLSAASKSFTVHCCRAAANFTELHDSFYSIGVVLTDFFQTAACIVPQEGFWIIFAKYVQLLMFLYRFCIWLLPGMFLKLMDSLSDPVLLLLNRLQWQRIIA